MEKKFLFVMRDLRVKMSVVRNEDGVISNIKFGVGKSQLLSLIFEGVYGGNERFTLYIGGNPEFTFEKNSMDFTAFHNMRKFLPELLRNAADNEWELKFGGFFYENHYGDRVITSGDYFEINPCRNLEPYFRFPRCYTKTNGQYIHTRCPLHEGPARIKIGA